eukprot:CAMPEP_0194218608 /NCGR_PEP_ID=MMETSP0156-20130528/24140_1 /TAXON_ID=33649 /ORGANISM="Thalassionema nitzschioides, Strain L26-B" /LENGTH=280 /DNA_ID=CAMNT_0038948019 /DNA_START=309 /DNA_END=1151 /DNA_ORIENTATION=+
MSKNNARSLSLPANKKGDDFPDRHALLEYLDGPSEVSTNEDKSEFISFEDYQDLQRREAYLKACPLFRSCSDADFSRIAKAMVKLEVSPGEKIVSQGESGSLASAMYFLKSGSMQAIGELKPDEDDKGSNSETKVIYKTYSKEGDFFGELALLYGQPRAASIIGSGSEPSQVYRLDKNAFLDSLEDSPVFYTAKRLILAKYRSNRLWDVIPKIRFDELVGLAKARLLPSSKNRKRIKSWLTTLRTYTLGSCAMYAMANFVKTTALKPLIFLALGTLAHLL